ncbi:MAG: hypothetical protein A3B99_05395 [Candidatus Yanofskybacteria bacterium RIFCSPHIGHO2_02_FULL_44_12b]|nr:MAG: hypothetical protein A2659_04545 [Candidatus Yanofskybacteria bacterium RIFCSPHIGHO2_01_FULL_44_24]OGN14080.1 MAG: hypothetical protein A3B99_05395 [Candidatus Yanofskybacteria bacterium RIFCSPHIGHO2_02_FULL_44_12b]OGN25162.1 MAG: hypothetical protein A2925_02915 [Candidatus Yanofskybacteria bacterium RIFCSPLOWO2_01_FULL_44_22]
MEYPSEWSIVYEDKDRGVLNVSSISLEKYANGGLPPAGTMEISVVKGACMEPSEDFLRVYLVEDGKGPSFLRKRACFDGYRITLSIWEFDLDKNKKKLLEKILKSFRATN